jgi:type I restriction enzyme M protein
MVLAIERALSLVKPKGVVAIVVAEGLLDNPSDRQVREYIKNHAQIEAVISLADSTFEGYGAKARTSILILRRKKRPDSGSQGETFMALADNTGYARNGSQVPGNELPEILLEWQAFQRGELSTADHAWTTVVGDRLDPKFYRARSATPTADVDALAADVNQRVEDFDSKFGNFATDVSHAFQETQFKTQRLGDLFEEIQERHRLEAEADYRLLGVRWWGGGTFIREEKRGQDIKAKSLFKVVPGWLIYNRLFAFRGSFAVVPEEHGGCYVSGEFPTFKVKEGDLDPALLATYVAHLLNSPRYLEIVDAQSTGSTKESRNRWNQAHFKELQAEIPIDGAGLARMVDVLERTSALRREQEELLERSKALRDGVALMLPMPGDSKA